MKNSKWPHINKNPYLYYMHILNELNHHQSTEILIRGCALPSSPAILLLPSFLPPPSHCCDSIRPLYLKYGSVHPWLIFVPAFTCSPVPCNLVILPSDATCNVICNASVYLFASSMLLGNSSHAWLPVPAFNSLHHAMRGLCLHTREDYWMIQVIHLRVYGQHCCWIYYLFHLCICIRFPGLFPLSIFA